MKILHIHSALTLLVTAPSAISKDETTTSLRGLLASGTKNKKTVSFPVVPHHQVVNRRRLELGLDESWMPEEEEGVERRRWKRQLHSADEEEEEEEDGSEEEVTEVDEEEESEEDGEETEDVESSEDDEEEENKDETEAVEEEEETEEEEEEEEDDEGPHHPQQLGALYQGYGTHYVDVWVGKPYPQRQTVIVDTGSTVTAFPCAGCNDCGEEYHTDEYFHTQESKTYQVTDCESSRCNLGSCTTLNDYNHKVCNTRMSYAEGSSWSAVEATDVMYAGGPHDGALIHLDEAEAVSEEKHIGDSPQDAYVFELNMSFGCQYRITGLFKTQLATGIMGMEDSPKSFWKQMYNQGVIDEKRFSLCFSRQPTASREGTEAGAMTIGGTDTRFHSTPMLYARNVQSTSYGIRLKAIYLRKNGGESALPDNAEEQVVHNIGVGESTMANWRIIVDSGTTDTYLPSSIHSQFSNVWKEITGHAFNNSPMNLSPEELLALPTVLFQVEAHQSSIDEELDPETTPGLSGLVDAHNPHDILIAMPASHYMEWSEKSDMYTPRIYMSERSGGVLGANTMQGHDVHFDSENNRIGWAESDCDYMGLISGVADTDRS